MRLPLLLLPALLLCYCGGLGRSKKPEPTAKSGQTTLVGIVEMVNPEQNYVLIRCEQPHSYSAGTELIALDASGSRAKLLLTPERKGHYLTADIKEGQPKVMNLVLHQQGAEVPAPAPAPPSPAPAPPTIPLDPFPPLPDIPLEQFTRPAPAPTAPVQPNAPDAGLEPIVR